MCDVQLQEKMIDLLFAWQKWEIAFIFGNTEWESRLPQFTPDIFDKYLEIQAEREKLLEKIKGIDDDVKNMSSL